ncbi:hypothetical protein IM793_11570 [Pedobacter sp. MR2016-19]|uniref:hypothetical protein n=1 Tax=Pedobacter sp. MR2016-19 TaxID=2780089 RepID=UPI001876A288|nr:hypothetical protein [Pedobacter sp. MR2016-19]MBE5319800.1 hypothetical protein [Pedobacter sp. MR2016-19]
MKTTLKNLGMTATVALGLFTGGCKKELGKDGSGNYDHAKTAGFSNPSQLSIPVNADGVIQDSFDGNASDNIINLTSSTVWLIDGVSYVPSGKTLKIAPGTILSSGAFKSYTATEAGVNITKNIRGVLVVVKGAKLDAQGTAALPIIFTSPNAPGSRAAGDFGGVILLGDAPINQPTTTVIEGLPTPPSGVDITYGGTDNTDNSGTLKYVRIEYPGLVLFANNEINGLTLGGVGSGTTLDHIQVTYSADDSFEFFGGTVNATYLVAAGGDDDDFDFDFGYTGTIQYAVGLKALNSTHSTSGGASDANGIESDNDKTGSGATPRTTPVLKNFTILGTNTTNSILRAGARLRRNSSFDIQNSVFGGFPTGVIKENSASGTFTTNILHAFTAAVVGAETPNSTATNANSYLQFGAIGGLSPFYLGDATAYNVGQLVPRATSPASTSSPYAGAIAPGTSATGTWLQGWTLLTPQNQVY